MAFRREFMVLLAFAVLQIVSVELFSGAAARPDPTYPRRLVCKMLPTDRCAFAVDSQGYRCVLETLAGGVQWHVCQTSNITAGAGVSAGYEENDYCVDSCGESRATQGLGTDSLQSGDFTAKLCSPECQSRCTNLVDLYSTLAFAEGKDLKAICAWHDQYTRRRATEVLTAVLEAAPGPVEAAPGPVEAAPGPVEAAPGPSSG